MHERDDQQQPAPIQRDRVSRSPLVIGAIAFALLGWMILTIFLLIAWRLTSQ